MPFDEHNVPGALFGSPTIVFPFREDSLDAEDSRLTFGSGGRLQRSLNRRFSAATIVTAFNPGLRRVELLIDQRVEEIEARAEGECGNHQIFAEEERIGSLPRRRRPPSTPDISQPVRHYPSEQQENCRGS